MSSMLRAWGMAASVVLLASCERNEPLLEREVFRWSDQPIAFAPPPQPWYREGELSGGVKGIRFVKGGGRGEGITVGEIHRVGERNRSSAIQELIDGFEEESRRNFQRDLQRAKGRTDDFYTDAEEEVTTAVNAALDRASLAFINGDRNGALAALNEALEAAGELEFTLEDLIDHPTIDPLQRPEVGGKDSIARREMKVGLHDAVRFDWTMRHDNRTFHRSEIYLVHNSHLFTLRFIGLEETLELFDRIVASIEFPE